MGTPSISMGHLYHSYVSLPEGTCCFLWWFHLASQRDPTGRIRCTPPGIKAWLKPCGWARWESTPFRKAPKLMWKPLETHGNSYKFINILGICVSPPKKIAKIGGRIVLCQSISSISHGKIIFMVLFLLVSCEIWGQYHIVPAMTFNVFFVCENQCRI